MSLDGNFSLVRKASSGRSLLPPKHGAVLFLDDKEVKEFVDSHSATEKPVNSVSVYYLLSDFFTYI